MSGYQDLLERARAFAPIDLPLGVAVSGGSDSLAMLHLFGEVGRTVEVVTIDHGLRPESTDEAEFVAEHCKALGVSHKTLRWEGPEETGNLQDQARRARYALMGAWAKSRGLSGITLGHTADDEAETFLMRLGRGPGIDGLTRLDKQFEFGGMTFLRPFTDFRRSDLRAYLQAKSVRWIDDPSNDDERFDRVKARKILAALEPLGVSVDSLHVTMGNLSLAQLALKHLARDEAEKSFKEHHGDLVFERQDVLDLSLETIRRILVGAVLFISGRDYPPRREALNEMWEGVSDKRTLTLNGCLISHKDGKTRITREFNAVKDLCGATDQLWDGRWSLEGPHAANLEIRALGEVVKDCPGWRDTGMPRASLLASPAVWRGDELIAAPVAGLSNGWTASATGRGKFAEFLLSR